MHCARCYREIEQGAEACGGCGLPVAAVAGRTGAVAGRSGGAGRTGVAPGAPAPSWWDPNAPSGAWSAQRPPYAPPPYPGYGPPSRPPPSSKARMIVLGVLVLAMVVLGPVLLATRVTNPPASTAGPVARPRRSVPSRQIPTTAPRSQLTLEEAMVPTASLANGPILPQDPGRHLTTDDAVARLLGPAAAQPANLETVRDAVHRAGTDTNGVVWDLTVIELEDPGAAAALVTQSQSSAFLGTTMPVPALVGASARERGQPADHPTQLVETIVLQQRNYVVVSSATVAADAPVLERFAQHADIVVPLATLQDKLLACGANPYNAKPPGC